MFINKGLGLYIQEFQLTTRRDDDNKTIVLVLDWTVCETETDQSPATSIIASLNSKLRRWYLKTLTYGFL